MPSQLLITVTLLINGFALGGDDSPCAPYWMPEALKRLIPQEFAQADYRPACRRHDACYTASGIPRRACDRQFLCDLRGACRNSTHPIRCRHRANLMFVAVRLFGRPSYEPRK
jgi:hypothetical protein